MLKLQPTFSDLSRQEIEAHLMLVRSRRLQASIEYHQAANMKLQRESDMIQRRITQQYEMLGKELLKLEALEGKVELRLNKLTMLLQEVQTIDDLLT